MSILDFEKEIDKIPVIDLAQEIYDKQLGDIINISHTDGYKQIKDYWKRVSEGAEAELKTVHPEYLNIVQMKCRIAEDFITFLDNLENAKTTRQKTKIKEV